MLAFTATGAAVDETAVCDMIVDFDDGQVEYDGEVTP